MGRCTLLGLALTISAGCLSVPPSDNPLHVRSDPVQTCENPVLIAPGQPVPDAYPEVFEKVLSVVGEYFEIAYSNRYDGRIMTHPKIAPGIGEPWRPGSPDARERLLATLQTIRYRGVVQIRAAEAGGYLVQVVVYRELKDEGRPMMAPSGSVFRDAPPIDRQFEVVDPSIPTDDRWIPKGRESALEDAILQKIRRCQFD